MRAGTQRALSRGMLLQIALRFILLGCGNFPGELAEDSAACNPWPTVRVGDACRRAALSRDLDPEFECSELSDDSDWWRSQLKATDNGSDLSL